MSEIKHVWHSEDFVIHPPVIFNPPFELAAVAVRDNGDETFGIKEIPVIGIQTTTVARYVRKETGRRANPRPAVRQP